MPVVINEFEIAPSTEQDRGAGAESAAGSGEAASPAPAPEARAQEAERLLRRRAERALRLWAH